MPADWTTPPAVTNAVELLSSALAPVPLHVTMDVSVLLEGRAKFTEFCVAIHPQTIVILPIELTTFQAALAVMHTKCTVSLVAEEVKEPPVPDVVELVPKNI